MKIGCFQFHFRYVSGSGVSQREGSGDDVISKFGLLPTDKETTVNI